MRRVGGTEYLHCKSSSSNGLTGMRSRIWKDGEKQENIKSFCLFWDFMMKWWWWRPARVYPRKKESFPAYSALLFLELLLWDDPKTQIQRQEWTSDFSVLGLFILTKLQVILTLQEDNSKLGRRVSIISKGLLMRTAMLLPIFVDLFFFFFLFFVYFDVFHPSLSPSPLSSFSSGNIT